MKHANSRLINSFLTGYFLIHHPVMRNTFNIFSINQSDKITKNLHFLCEFHKMRVFILYNAYQSMNYQQKAQWSRGAMVEFYVEDILKIKDISNKQSHFVGNNFYTGHFIAKFRSPNSELYQRLSLKSIKVTHYV